jgi:acyl-CoA thioesterase-2
MPDGTESSIEDALDALLRALDLDAGGGDRYRAGNEQPSRFPNVFGGQLVAQALLAMSLTVEGQVPASLHAHFVAGGDVEQPLDLAVDRVRDGRSMSTRRMTASQDGRPVLIASASFETAWPASSRAVEPLPGPAPDELPTLQEWARAALPDRGEGAQRWIDRPPPLDIRIAEAPTFLSGAHVAGPRSHWLRLPRSVGDDATLHAVLLSYASDYFLLDMAVRSHPDGRGWGELIGSSLDHSIWLHRPVDFHGWHRYTQELLAVDGQRGLVRGSLHERDGHLVASTAQEVLVRPLAGP